MKRMKISETENLMIVGVAIVHIGKLKLRIYLVFT